MLYGHLGRVGQNYLNVWNHSPLWFFEEIGLSFQSAYHGLQDGQLARLLKYLIQR